MRHIVKPENIESTLREIYMYTAEHWGLAQANKYHAQFEAAFEALAVKPGLGHTHPEIPQMYSIYPVGSHLVVYRADDKTLRIIAIFHNAMDIEARMFDILKTYNLH